MNNSSSKIMINFKQRKAFWNVPSVPVRGVDSTYISTAGAAGKLSPRLQVQGGHKASSLKNDMVGTRLKTGLPQAVCSEKRTYTTPALSPPSQKHLSVIHRAGPLLPGAMQTQRKPCKARKLKHKQRQALPQCRSSNYYP